MYRQLFIFAFFPLIAFAESPSVDSHTLKINPPKAKAAPCPRLDLHAAVRSGDVKCVETAITNMDVNDRDQNGDTPLHNAIQFKNAKAIRYLVSHGADIHLYDFHGMRPQGLAESLGFRRLAEYFLEVERETERLEQAVENNDIVAASSSLQRGASLGMRDIRLDTLLHRAAQSNLPEMGKLLIHHGARLEARNYLGETALHAAALRDFQEFMAMLLTAGANPNALDERRRTPLDIAEIRANPKVLALLKKNRARAGSSASVEHDWSECGAPL